MKKTTKATTAALCALMLSSPLTLGISADSPPQYSISGEQESEFSVFSDDSGNMYLDLTERAISGVSVRLDGKEILRGQGRIINSVTYVPLRAFCDALGGADISWDQSTRTATYVVDCVNHIGQSIWCVGVIDYSSELFRHFHRLESSRYGFRD